MPPVYMKRERISRHWTQRYVAKIVGLTPTAICDIENGKALPSYSVMCKLEDLFFPSPQDTVSTKQG